VLAYIGCGSNLGHSRQTLFQADREIDQLADTCVTRTSAVYRSSPVGVSETQPDYLNSVIELQTSLSSRELLAEMMAIEARHGRVRSSTSNQARTLDLDLLLYGNETRTDSDLTLPHPRIQDRAFVLYPLHELEPGLEIPGHGRVSDLLAAVAEQDIEKL
jgi:2-amino-4-hydroxy-6-hydroxymethyldihydropteridine diphosphokinase